MADQFRVEIQTGGSLLQGSRTVEGILFAEAERALEDITGIIEREVEREAPVGATGRLRGSIVSSVQGRTIETLRGRVASTAEHADAVEFGRGSGNIPPWGPGSPLFGWVRRKLGVSGPGAKSVSFLIARSIARRGTKGSGFFRRAMERSQRAVETRIQKLGTDIVEKLSG